MVRMPDQTSYQNPTPILVQGLNGMEYTTSREQELAKDPGYVHVPPC